LKKIKNYNNYTPYKSYLKYIIINDYPKNTNLPKYFYKLVSFFLKRGKINKQVNLLLSVFSHIYRYTLNKLSVDGLVFNKYFNIKEFIFILTNDRYLNNISTILKWVITLNYSQFDLNIQKVSKKYKKKSKQKYLYKIKYLNKRKQINKVLKWIYLSNYNFNTYSFKKRCLLNILDLLLNFKKSNLFLKKTMIYKNFLKI